MTSINRQTHITILLGMLVLLGLSAVISAQEDTPQTITIGQTLTLDVPTTPPSQETPNVTLLSFSLDAPQAVTIIARAEDGDPSTDPVVSLFELRNGTSRELITLNNNPNAPQARSASDAILNDQLLLAGAYNLAVWRADTNGTGRVVVSMEEGNPGPLGLGEITVIEGSFALGERYRLTSRFDGGRVFAVGAVADDAEVDLRLAVRDTLDETTGNIAISDDVESFAIFYSDFDPLIPQVVIPEDDDYLIQVRGFGSDDSGGFRLVLRDYGTLNTAAAGSEIFSGSLLANQRNTIMFEGSVGEIVNIIGSATEDSLLDPEIALFDPNNVLMERNDDQGTEVTDLRQLDSYIGNVLLPATGTYQVEISSVVGQGGYEVVVERIGVVEPGPGLVLDYSVELNTPEPPTPTPEPEATEELGS